MLKNVDKTRIYQNVHGVLKHVRYGQNVTVNDCLRIDVGQCGRL